MSKNLQFNIWLSELRSAVEARGEDFDEVGYDHDFQPDFDLGHSAEQVASFLVPNIQ